MTTPDQPNTSARTIDRRKVVGGLAWSVPTVAIATAAPAMAVSPIRDPGLQGWVTVSGRCQQSLSPRESTSRITIDGRGQLPDRGLWVYNTGPEGSVRDASITFYFPTTLGTLTWSSATASQWTTPVVDNSQPVAGHIGYTTRYNGTFVYSSAQDLHYATSLPHFTATSTTPGFCPRRISAYARRTVTATVRSDGQYNTSTVTFLRGPVYLG